MRKLITKIVLWLIGVVLSLEVSFYYTKENSENIWKWLINQINPLSIMLFLIILIITFKSIIWDKIKNKKNEELTIEDQLVSARAAQASELSDEEKNVNKLVDEIKNDKNLCSTFEDIILNLNNREFEFFEREEERIRYFIVKSLIRKEANSRLYLFTDRGKKVREKFFKI